MLTLVSTCYGVSRRKDRPINDLLPIEFGLFLIEDQTLEYNINFQNIWFLVSRNSTIAYWLFWSNPHKIEVMMTSLIDMLELPNFDHTISTI